MLNKVLCCYLTLYLIIGGFVSVRNAYAQSEDKLYRVAALDLDANGVSQIEAKGLSDKLRSHISTVIQRGENLKSRYELIERTDMDKILDQFDFQSTGCVSDSCAVEFGKMLQVDRIVIGSVSLIGSTYSVIARIIDVESSKTVGSSDKSLRGSIDDVMTNIIPEVGNELFMNIKKKSRLKWYLLGAAVLAAGAGAAVMGGGGEESVPDLLPKPPGRPSP